MLLEDRLLPQEHANIPGQGGGQALGFFLQLLLILEHTSSVGALLTGKVECRAESSKLHGIFPRLGDHNVELVLSLVGVLTSFPFLGLEARHFLLQPWPFGSKPPDLSLTMEEYELLPAAHHKGPRKN